MKDKNGLKTLLPLLKFQPWAIPIIIIIGILSSLSEGFGISLLIPFFQNLVEPTKMAASGNPLIDFFSRLFMNVSPNQRIIVIPLWILGCVFLKNCLSYGNTVFFCWLNARIRHRLCSGIFDQILFVGLRYLESKDSGKLLNTLANETWQTSRALSILVSLVTDSCTVIILIGLLVMISWKLTLLVGTAILFISIFIKLMTKSVEQLGQKAVRTNEELAFRMLEGLAGIRMIRAYGCEEHERKRFKRASLAVRNTLMKLDMLSMAVDPLHEVLTAIVLICILAFALFKAHTTLPVLLTFMFVLYRLLPQVKRVDAGRVVLTATMGSVNNVVSFLDPTDKPYMQDGTVPFKGLKRAIRFESVSFYYNPHDKPALDNVSLEIARGKTTALVGPSGGGKSTLINLICRFYDADSGRILADDHLIEELDLASWRRQLAIVSQDVHIFNTSVRENIAYGRLDASDDEIIEAARLANAHDFIVQLPDGYDTHVGERGIRLSGGQRQRIALARAIVRDPSILILDEATNALDTISEHLIQEALNTLSRNRTVIIIAHRLSTIAHADQIYVLSHGRVIEQGNIHQLLEANGLFVQLYHHQYQNEPRVNV